jgi:hypothetical protein
MSHLISDSKGDELNHAPRPAPVPDNSTIERMKPPSPSPRGSEGGFTIVETLIAVLVFSFAAIIAAQHLAVGVTLLGLHARQRLAEAQAVSAVSKVIASRPPDYTGSLVPNADGTVTLGTLQAGYYDYVVSPDPMSTATPPLPPGCGAWPCAVDPSAQPPNTKVVYVRAWNIFTVNSGKGLHQVRAAVFPSTALVSGGDQTALTFRWSRFTYH